MADNYQLFSEIIPSLTEEEQAWARRILGCTQDQDGQNGAEDAGAMLKDGGIDLSAVDSDAWPGFQWNIDETHAGLWVYGEECGNVIHVAEFVRAFLAMFRPTACWQLTWAETCSKPRVGEFSGGGLFVTAASVTLCMPQDWLAERSKEFDRAAAASAGAQ